MMTGRAGLTATAQTMQDLANRLSNQLDRPVIDNTGLTQSTTSSSLTRRMPTKDLAAADPPLPAG